MNLILIADTDMMTGNLLYFYFSKSCKLLSFCASGDERRKDGTIIPYIYIFFMHKKVIIIIIRAACCVSILWTL